MRQAQRTRVTDFSRRMPFRPLALGGWHAGMVFIGLAAGVEIAAFIGTSVLRAIYPYSFDGLEPGALQEVARVLAGQPLYVAPSLEYVPQIYGPVYFYLAAPLAAISGSGQFGLRATSLLASLGSIVLLTLIVRRETGSLAIGLFGGALLAACNQLVDGAMDIGRTDATMLFFMLASIYAARRACFEPTAGWPTSAVGGCMMGLALSTKQSSAPLAVALIVVVAVIRRDQLAAFALALALTFAATMAVLVAQSGHWPLFYLWELPRQHEILPQYVWRIWGDIVTRFAAPALVGPFYLVACALRGDRKRLVFYTVIPLAMIGMAWATQATIRGGRNVELPVYAAVAMLAALSVHEALRWIGSATQLTRAARAYVLAASIGQLLVLFYNPRLVIPLRSDKWAGDRLAATLAALPGPIFAGTYQAYVRGIPGAVAPDLEAVVELQGEQQRPSTPEGEQWSGELAGAIVSRRFSYLIVNPDSDGFIVSQLADAYGYRDVGPLFASDDVYWQWRTSWAPKAEVFIRPDASP